MMELEENSVNCHTEMNNMDDVGVKGSIECGTGLESDLDNCRKRCLDLETEVTKLKCELVVLNCFFEALGVEKLAVEEELRVLRKKNVDLQVLVGSQGGITDGLIDLTDEKVASDMVNLMIENKVLECEKKKAESEVEIWKGKFRELEGLLMGSGGNSLSRKLEGSKDLPEVVKNEMIEATDLKDGLTSAMPLLTENKLEGGEEKVDAENCLGSTLYFRDKGNGNLESSGTPITPFNTLAEREDRGTLPDKKLENGSRVRKQLFGETGSPNKKIAPSTPAGARPASVCVIDIGDSDCESETNLPKNEFTMRKKLRRTILEESDEEDIDPYKGSSPLTATPKRKRASNIVTSDSECDDDDDDNKPICKLISQPPEEVDVDSHLSSFPDEKVEEGVTGRRLRLRKCELKDEPQRSSPSPSKRLTRLRRCEIKHELERSSLPSPSKLKTCKNESLANEDEEDEDMGGDGSGSEGESLGGFIVESSDEPGSADDSEGGDESVNADAADESDDDLDGNMDIGEIMSKIRRKRNLNLKWEFEADMLASFGKDPEVCMKAVCALYRQQTADEKNCKGTLHSNQRGFSQCDASRGTKLAEFLTDGDPEGDLVKSVKQLEAHDRQGVELCRMLATPYSKQLFEIYQNEEDPFFLPS